MRLFGAERAHWTTLQNGLIPWSLILGLLIILISYDLKPSQDWKFPLILTDGVNDSFLILDIVSCGLTGWLDSTRFRWNYHALTTTMTLSSGRVIWQYTAGRQ